MNIATDRSRTHTTALRTDTTTTAATKRAHRERAGVLDLGTKTVDGLHEAGAHVGLKSLGLGENFLGCFVNAAGCVADRAEAFAASASQVAAVPDSVVVDATWRCGVVWLQEFDVGVGGATGKIDL